MARTKEQIYSYLVAKLIEKAATVGIIINPLNWSKTDYKSLILDTVATAQAIEEQLQDSVIEDVEAIAKRLPPQTPPWLQYQMINIFQYDAIAVPIVQLDVTTNFVPYYPVINPNWNIIKFCSVVPGTFGTTTVKVSKVLNGLPTPLTSTELDAAQSFLNIVAVPGVTYNATSLSSDKMFMQLDVYYKGLYSSVIEANVIAAINTYFNNINYDGFVVLSDLVLAIKAVSGVIDCVLENVKARANSTTVGFGTQLVNGYDVLQRNWGTVSGFMIPENTTGANWRLQDFRVGSSGLKNLNLISQ